MKLTKLKKTVKKLIGRNDTPLGDEDRAVLLGKILSRLNNEKQIINSIQEVEFKVFSQWGDDGIIQYLTNKIKMPKSFIEFGVETYREANTRFLLMNDNWSGLVIDGSKENIDSVHSEEIYWKFDLKAIDAFITKENINTLISSNGFAGEIGILSVDIDGNDYWVLKAIDVVKPVVIIVEYNSLFGNERYISVPYDATFFRRNAHFSNLFFGASLPAFNYLCVERGYTLIGCNSNGNNAYFVRNDKLGNLPAPGLEKAFVHSKFRESRSQKNELTYLDKKQQLEIIKGLEVINVKTNLLEPIQPGLANYAVNA
jgi:hypothetical protein